MEEKHRKSNALTITLACVVVVLCVLSGFLFYRYNEEAKENASTVKSLTSENRTLHRTVSEQEETIDEQLDRISDLETRLASPSTSASSSGYSSSSSNYSSYTSSTSDTQTVTVYITRTGEKYHQDGCQYLRQSQIAISLSDAKDRGYTACSRCF